MIIIGALSKPLQEYNMLFNRRNLIGIFALVIASALPVHAADNPKVKAAMESLKKDLNNLGPAKVDGDNLFFGSSKINGDFTVVDSIKAKQGATATVFVKKGANYVRISTNVMKGDARAVGTPLDPNGPAKAAIDQGKGFYGIVDILGKLYDTGYEPIKNAKGETIGIFYVGFSME